nr:fumarylacetoacetate hydrolase family protein [Microbacterium hydrocarbonoxydans]
MTSPSLTVELQRLADDLHRAEADRAPVAPPSSTAPELTVDGAYAVQRTNIARRLDAGERVIGRKIGLTSRAMQQQLGVDSPDFGVVTDAMVVPDRGRLDLSELIAPRVEAELAFRIGRDLPPSPTRSELLDAVDGVAVALEVIDSRVADWRIGLVDTIADNASSARIVTGAFEPATPELVASLPDLVVTLRHAATAVAEGRGSAVLGDPIVSLLWLAEAIGGYGENFSAGDIVLAGAVARAVDLVPDAEWTASAPGFRPVSFRTTSGGS